MKSISWMAFVLALLLGAGPARSHIVDTGVLSANPVGADAFDANDFNAGQVPFVTATSIHDIGARVPGSRAGERFTIITGDDFTARLPGRERYAATARFGADGRDGISGLLGRNLAAGLTWIGSEIGANEWRGSTADTGALPDSAASNSLVRTAFVAGSGDRTASRPLTSGIQVDALDTSAISEPGSMALIFAGIAFLVSATRRRRR